MGFFDWFPPPKPAPVVIIRNVLGEEIDRIPAWDLCNQDLHGKQWMHADLSNISLAGANCEGINLFGARLVHTAFLQSESTGRRALVLERGGGRLPRR
jgi:hypothetical protein